MAFPLSTLETIAQLRLLFSGGLDDNDDRQHLTSYPIKTIAFAGQRNIPEFGRSDSPPIELQISRHGQRNLEGRHEEKLFSESRRGDFGADKDQEKFSGSNHKGHPIQEESIEEDAELQSVEVHLQEPDDDAVTIDSDFGVPINVRGEVVEEELEQADRNLDYKVLTDPSLEAANTLAMKTDDDGALKYGVDVEEVDEVGEDEEEYESSDSAFTDIETDSILNSTLLLDQVTLPVSPRFSFSGKDNSEGARKKNKKKRRDLIDSGSVTADSSSLILKKLNISKSQLGLSFNLSNTLTKKESMLFQKVDLNSTEKQPLNSNLSNMIKLKNKSAGLSPLEYFSFVEYSHDDSDVSMTRLIVFRPPSSAIVLRLKVKDNVSVMDCIGYILLSLLELPQYKANATSIEFMNPNNWRLELADEDGESFGSFGFLDRSRLISSYSGLKEVALSEVTDPKERLKIEQSSPLPQEFKNSLLGLHNSQNGIKIGEEIEDEPETNLFMGNSDESIEFKIFLKPSEGLGNDCIRIYASPSSTVGEILRKVCQQKNLRVDEHVLAEILPELAPVSNATLMEESTLEHDAMTSVNPIKVLKPEDLLKNMRIQSLELINKKLLPQRIPSASHSNLPQDAITPVTGRILPVSSPKSQLDDSSVRAKGSKNSTSLYPSKSRAKSRKSGLINSDKFLDDIIAGNIIQPPPNINNIYFKWKVWRKKATIINKIEKFLVIDGDYIHLTPVDDVKFKGNHMDDSFMNPGVQTQNHSHHINHYNYNKYYVLLMLKTSSFHISQIVKLKQYKNSKNPSHFKIVIDKPIDPAHPNVKESKNRKKYDLDAESPKVCQEIIDKLKWATQAYLTT